MAKCIGPNQVTPLPFKGLAHTYYDEAARWSVARHQHSSAEEKYSLCNPQL